jgi:tetratricopeptide (TPR) repeat protein
MAAPDRDLRRVMASTTDGLRSTTVKSLRLEAERLQREGDFEAAFKAYEDAVALAPDDPDLLTALAQLASQVGMHDVAVQLWACLYLSDPTSDLACDGYARSLIAVARFPEAIDVLKSGLQLRPEEGRHWTTLGLALTYAGRADEALTFFNEGVRLSPQSAVAIYNRGLALCDLGQLTEAEQDFRAAAGLAREASERATIEFSLATTTLARGDLASGWPLYERRLSPDAPTYVAFQGLGRRLDMGEPVAGRSVLVFAEQGIGDEIQFANTLPDLIEDTGPDGRLVLAVETRLVELFQRSFPKVEVCAHATPRAGARPMRRTRVPVSGRIDLWAPMASLAQRYRRSLGDFPGAPYLRPDPQRVAHWRAWLGAERPAFGLTWRSGATAGDRQRLSPPLSLWAELLQTPGAQFVNVQYGDCEADLAQLTALSGVEVRRPPGLNIRDDLDDLAALCSALDGLVGIQNATSVLAGACGAPVVFVAGPGAWYPLGQDKAPWFADARVCTTDAFSDWTPAMTSAAEAIGRIMTLTRPSRADGA